MKRMSRREKQAHTRSCLIASAAKVFAQRGLDKASIDEVAEDAGYTKGAFYANFKNKEELFLAMLDERFAARLEEIDRAAHAEGDPPQQARQAAAEFIQAIAADDEWERLFFEFSAFAARNEDFRQELVTRYRTLRSRMAGIYRRRFEELQMEPPIPPDHLALMSIAMANGIAMERLLEPELVSEELYAKMLETFFTGVGAMWERAGARQPDPA